MTTIFLWAAAVFFSSAFLSMLSIIIREMASRDNARLSGYANAAYLPLFLTCLMSVVVMVVTIPYMES